MTTRFLTAFKIALSIAIAYGIALSMDWDNPHWAGLSIAFCSLMTTGESLQKGLLRTFGTFAAIFVALTLLALFPQQRWVFAVCVSLWVGFCTLMMFGNARWYFWFCAGMGVPLLSMLSGGESLQAFQTVVLRAQETILGTVVFTLVSSFVFPSRTRAAFEQDVAAQVADLRRAFLAGRDAIMAGAEAEGAEKADTPAEILRAAALRQRGLIGKLNAAALDSFDVAETRAAWRRAIVAMGGLVDAMERWRLGFPELRGAEPAAVLNGLEPTLKEIHRRLQSAGDLASGPDADVEARPVELSLDESRAEQIPAFRRAALIQTDSRLREIEQGSRELLAAKADIRGVAKGTSPKKPATRPEGWLPDPERVSATLRVFTAFWLSFLAYIYIPDLPSWVTLIAMTTAVSMLMVMSPTLPLKGLAKPTLLSILFGGAVHILVLPHLTGYGGLALTMFIATFGICWICHKPQQGMGRALGLAFFVIMAQVESVQTYSFTFVADMTVAFGLVIAILATVAYIPVSFRPEKVFLRMLNRYCASAERLLETLHKDKRTSNSWFEQRRRAYHARQLAVLPGRMAMWANALPAAGLGAGGQAGVQQLVAGLAMLTDRARDLLDLRDASHAEAWVEVVLDDLRGWRLAIQDVLLQLGAKPETLSSDPLAERLADRMARLEQDIADAIRRGIASDVPAAQSDTLFRELAGFRGVSDALLSVIDQASMVDWMRMREARF